MTAAALRSLCFSLAAVPSPKPPRHHLPIFFSRSIHLSLLQAPLPLSSTATLARRKKSESTTSAPGRPQKFIQDTEEGYIDEDPLEVLFSQLEEDLKDDEDLPDNIINDEDDINEHDLAKLEQELDEAFDDDAESLSELLNPDLHVFYSDEEEEDIEKMPKLKNWQLRRLATALKVGRRKTQIKNLAGELGLDRTVVLELLRHPPPNLLMVSASLPERIADSPVNIESKQVQSPAPEVPDSKPKHEEVVPVHVRQASWLKQKRLKKVQVGTLEKVYHRTKRPTNAMISSIVYVTKLPWKRVVKWFEDRRNEEGGSEQRASFQRFTIRTNRS